MHPALTVYQKWVPKSATLPQTGTSVARFVGQRNPQTLTTTTITTTRQIHWLWQVIKYICIVTTGSGSVDILIQFFNSSKSVSVSVSAMESKQESPPAWTQEAYRPPCSDYFCCPNWAPPRPDLAGGVPWWGGGIPWQGTPHPDRARGGTLLLPPRQGTPQQGTPHPWLDLAGYPPPQLDLAGYPPAGYSPPPAGPGRVPPRKCCKALWDMGTPLPPYGQTDGRTDACQNITFPSYYVRGR